MGSTVSRPRLSQVAPTLSQEEENRQHRHPQPQWTLPALPLTLDQNSLGQKKTALPPLKCATTTPLSESSLAGSSSPSTLSNNPSIIHSHPPRRPQVRECSDGGVQRFSSRSQTTGVSGTNRLIQGGFLDAQSALNQKTYRHRRAHHCQAREQRRQKTVYTANVGGLNKEGIQRLHLVRRPTEKDIFWDESTGESLDFRHLLQPSPLPPLGQEAKQQMNSLLQCKVENPAWSNRAERPQELTSKIQQTTRHTGDCRQKRSTWAVDMKGEITEVTGKTKGHTTGWLVQHPDKASQGDILTT